MKSRKYRSIEWLQRAALTALAAFATVALWACASGSASDSPPAPVSSADEQASAAASYSLRRYVSKADQAVGLTFDRRGRLLYNEKDTGRIIRYSHGRKSVLVTLAVHGGGEAGLLGLAVGADGKVYAYYTSSDADCPDPTKSSTGNSLDGHCVWAFKPTSKGKLAADHLVFRSAHPSETENHVGGGLHFGPEGALYLSLGDLGENDDPSKGPERAQSLDVPFGKLLRLKPDALNKGLASNPATCGNVRNTAKRAITDNRIFACGLRNSYGFAFDGRGRIWGAEAGDTCDEINLLRPGVNYGWRPPRTDCSGFGAGRPRVKLSGTPSGIAVPTRASVRSLRDDVFYCVYSGGVLMRLNPASRKQAKIGKANGKCGFDLVARGSALYMSSGDAIYRLAIRK